MNLLNEWLFFSLSNKAKYAIKVALSITLTYLFILAMGLEYASIAVITIMLIASPEGVQDSVSKGLVRIGGTLIGAVIGITLISLFPQEPFYYLLFLSITVTLLLYLRHAYTGDDALFMLSAMTTMAVFDNGGVDDVFMYGVDRTFITILSIVIYTLIFLIIWPNSSEKNSPDEVKNGPQFIWLDPEHIKGAIQTFIVFWIATTIWYFLNPPGGFTLVMLATGFSAITSFSPVKPSIMALMINISLLIAIIIYIFILPNLAHWSQLAILLFCYTFFAFYFFPPMVSILILIGLNTLMITNTMNYYVDVFLGIVLVMDMVFTLLILIYYLPFSSKPEYLYRLMLKRFTYLSTLQFHSTSIAQWYASTHLKLTVRKLKLWGSKIDFDYFHLIEPIKIETLQERIEALTVEIQNNKLSIEEQDGLKKLFHAWHAHVDHHVPILIFNISLFHNTLHNRLLECQQAITAIDWQHLERGRF